MSRKTENNYFTAEGEVLVRLRNRWISVRKDGDGLYTITLVRTTKPEERWKINESQNVTLYAGGKIMVTTIHLPREAFQGLSFAMAKFIEEGML